MSNHAVWKFPLKPGANIVEAPVVFRPLSAAFQNSEFGEGLMMWALVDPDAVKVNQRIAVVPTGVAFEDFAIRKFVGTVQHPGGTVWHVFHIE